MKLVAPLSLLVDILNLDAEDRTVLRLALRAYLTNAGLKPTRDDYIDRARTLLEQLNSTLAL